MQCSASRLCTDRGDEEYECIYENWGYDSDSFHETHSEDSHFQAKAKISVTEAEKAAIDKYSGVIVAREYGFASGKPSGEWVVVYNKKTYKGSFEEVLKQVPKLSEFSF